MTKRPFAAASIAVLALGLAACNNGRSTADTPITTTTPAGQSAAPSSARTATPASSPAPSTMSCANSFTSGTSHVPCSANCVPTPRPA